MVNMPLQCNIKLKSICWRHCKQCSFNLSKLTYQLSSQTSRNFFYFSKCPTICIYPFTKDRSNHRVINLIKTLKLNETFNGKISRRSEITPVVLFDVNKSTLFKNNIVNLFDNVTKHRVWPIFSQRTNQLHTKVVNEENDSDPPVHQHVYKLFPETENEMLRSILSQYEELKETLAPNFQNINEIERISDEEFKQILETNFNDLNQSEILDCFKKVTYFMYDKEDNLSHSSFDKLTEALIASIENMSGQDICEILYLLQLWSRKCFRKDKNFYEIYTEADKQLLKRITGVRRFNLQEMLLIIDHWSNLNLIRASNFCFLALKKVLNKCHQLPPKQFVQVMYYHCKARSFHPVINAYDLEYQFEKKLDALNPADVAIVCLAFFKSQKPFVNGNLVVKVARVFVNNFSQLNSVCVNGYLKYFRYWFPLHNWDLLYQVCDKLALHCDTLSHHCFSHAALVGTRLDVYHSTLIDKLVRRTLECKDKLRIKDFEKVLFAVVVYNHPLKESEACFFDVIIDEILKEERQEEVDRYSKILYTIVYNLILKNIYNLTLIEKCLDLDYLEKTFGPRLSGYSVPRHVLAIDFGVEIECPDYIGPRLPEPLKDTLIKHYAWRKPGELFHGVNVQSDEIQITLVDILGRILGDKSYAHTVYILPYFIKADILICLKDGRAVQIPEGMSNFVYHNAYPPPNIGTWYAFVCVPFAQLIKNTLNKFKGSYICKIRQLKELGYEPVVITASEWMNESSENRERIVRDKLGEALSGQ